VLRESASRAARTASSSSDFAPLRRAGRLGPVDLDHPLAVFEQERSQPGAEAPGPLDRPHPPARRVLPSEGEQPPVAERVGRDVGVGQHRAGGVGDGGAVMVAMGIDPDDVVDLVCEHET
jgi:hypothetical protein